MTRKKTKIVKELEPDEVEGYSPARIEHYLSLGYRPYLDERSHVKWLTQAQRSLRGAKNTRVPVTRRLIPQKKTGRYRKKKGHRTLYRFIREYWFFALTILIVVAFVVLIIVFPDQIF
jgi:hypothetical protein